MSTATQPSPLEIASRKIDRARTFVTIDINALPESELANNCGGKSRTPYDLLFELSETFHWFAGHLEGKPMEPPAPGSGWMKAPVEYQNKAKALENFKSATDRFMTVLTNFSGDPHEPSFSGPAGPATALDFVDMAYGHTLYHSGQLNYIQTIRGDDEFHWMKS